MQQCLFCPNPANSREHIWADWLRAYVPRTQLNHLEARIDVSDEGKEKHATKHVSGDPRSRKLKVVCNACNNNWMSQVQNRAKPHLVPLIEGREYKLPRQGRSALSRWAALFSTVQEQIHTDLASVSAEDRAWIKERSTAPNNWLIWIGRFVDPAGHSRSSRTSVPVVSQEEFARRHSRAGPLRYNGQASTFLVGNLLFHTLSAPRRLRFSFPSAIGQKLHRIWPTNGNGIKWPPQVLTEEDYRAITEEVRKRAESWRKSSDD